MKEMKKTLKAINHKLGFITLAVTGITYMLYKNNQKKKTIISEENECCGDCAECNFKTADEDIDIAINNDDESTTAEEVDTSTYTKFIEEIKEACEDEDPWI